MVFTPWQKVSLVGKKGLNFNFANVYSAKLIKNNNFDEQNRSENVDFNYS